MDALIVAIDHSWQMCPYGAGQELSEAATQFTNVLQRVMSERKVDLICEESDPKWLSIAQKMAFDQRPRIAWKNILMSAQERLEAGIYDALLHRPQEIVHKGGGAHQTMDHRIPEDEVREKFFARECDHAAKATGAKSVLILCGDMHADSLKAILEAAKHRVELNRELITEKHWQ